MASKRVRKAGSARAGRELAARKFKSRASKARRVEYLDQARRFFRKRRIHARRRIPLVQKGAPVADLQPSPVLLLQKPPPASPRRLRGKRGAAARKASSDAIAIVRKTLLGAVADNDTASEVCEPSVATNGSVVFFTGNWFAAVSTDGGATFRFVDPYTAFPSPPDMQFCCDQVVHYVRKIDTFVWLLQYDEGPDGANIQRLAFARSKDVAAGLWRTYDLTPAGLGAAGAFLDFPDLAVGSNFLYVSTNAYDGGDWASSILVRIPLAGIRSGTISATRVASTQNFNFRVAQHTGTSAYWASHQDTSTLRVFRWREKDAAPTFEDVAVARWIGGNGYSSKGPDGRHWLRRCDPRITGATKAGADLWFAWSADKGGANARPHPYVQIARVRASTRKLVENINLWDGDFATAYPALTTNSRGEVGVSYMAGGPTRFPSHIVGILTGQRRVVVATAGTRSPKRSEWGDYLTVRRHYPKSRLFAAAGYTMQAGAGQLDATPGYVLFGRSGDA